ARVSNSGAFPKPDTIVVQPFVQLEVTSPLKKAIPFLFRHAVPDAVIPERTGNDCHPESCAVSSRLYCFQDPPLSVFTRMPFASRVRQRSGPPARVKRCAFLSVARMREK